MKREDIFFTTKLQSNVSYEATTTAIADSLRECALGYVDLYLLHSPYGGTTKRLECWRAVMDAVEQGRIRSAGVSNFGVRHVCWWLVFCLFLFCMLFHQLYVRLMSGG